MPSTERSVVVKADRQRVYEIAKDFESFASFMPDVNSIEIKERGDGYTVSAWEVGVVGRTIRWTERDEFDDENYRIRYKQISGDLGKFEGEWRFEEVDEGVQITLTVDFDLGVPMLASLFTPVLTKVVQSNSDKMLQGIKQRAEEKE